MSISQTITDFVTVAIQAGGWMELDRLYLQNRVLAMIGEESLESITPTIVTKTSLELLDELVVQAIKNGKVKAEPEELAIFKAQIMDFLTPPPSVVNALFAQHYEKDPADATDYFHKLTQENDSIKTRTSAKKSVFPVETEYGQLEITINLSRSDKSPHQLASADQDSHVGYPKCVFCMENEGYKGRTNYPAKTNHRIIRMNLNGESWGFQYSSHPDYNEQSIIFSEEHRPMVISKETFRRLMKIVEVLPHYFVGFNEDVPIVGETTLTHDHYQAGRHAFPLEKAEIEQYFELSDFPLMNAGTVKWPMSVIRLQSPNSEDLVEAATLIFEKWRNYFDKTGSIQAFSKEEASQHSIAAIARRKGHLFELDLVLRDNKISDDYQEGIFSLYKEIQQNLSLAEVMGLVSLPSYLNDELQEVEKYVLEQENQMTDCHKSWADQLKEMYSFDEKNIKEIIQKAVGENVVHALTDASVYKRTPEGQAAFKRFIDSL